MSDTIGLRLLRGEELESVCRNLPRLRREAFAQLWAHVCAPPSGRVLVLAGAPLTGKRVLVRQAVATLTETQRASTALLDCGGSLRADYLAGLAGEGITRLFIRNRRHLQDSGDLSLLTRFAEQMTITLVSEHTLFFRGITAPGLDVLRLSHIPAREHMRLLGSEFPRCVLEGGRLRLSRAHEETSSRRRAWEDPQLGTCGRIREALDALGRGWARDRRAAGEWSEDDDDCMEATLYRISRQRALDAARRVMPRRVFDDWAGEVVDESDVKESVVRSHLRCLKLDDVLHPCPEEDPEGRLGTRWLTVQPNLSFSTAMAFLHDSLCSDSGSPDGKEIDGKKVLDALNDDFALDAALLDLLHAASDNVRIASLLLPGHHRGMVVSDMRRRRCALFTAVLHEARPVDIRPLREPAAITGLTRRHGAVVRQVLLHGGETREEKGILLQNAEEFLRLLDNPAYLDWLCRFDQEHAPAAPVNWSARRFRMPATGAGMKSSGGKRASGNAEPPGLTAAGAKS